MAALPEHIRHVPGARKPDPLSARTPSELEDRLRSLWAWAGRPSSRRLADRSGGAFSHATVSKLIHEKPGKPTLKLEYVLGLVRACGADQAETATLDNRLAGCHPNPGNHRCPGA